MSGPKINVSAGNSPQEIGKVGRAINDLAKQIAQANRSKFSPLDTRQFQQDVRTVQRQFEELKRVSRSFRDALKFSGQSGAGFHDVDWGRLHMDRARAAEMQRRAYQYSTRGTGWEMQFGGRGGMVPWGSRFGGQFAGSFASGLGGPFGQIAQHAVAGASAASGGLLSRAGGLAKGTLIGSAIYGAYKAGTGAMDGYDSAKEMATVATDLKRRMGDLGVSFSRLTEQSFAAAEGLTINATEAMKLQAEFHRLSGGRGGGLAEGVRGATQFGVGYGIDAGKSVDFFAQMRYLGATRSTQDDRRLALQIGEVINRSGMNARADEVLGAVTQFANITARVAFGSPNVGAYGGAYAGLKASGMTHDAATGILSSANATMMNGGAMGEASMNMFMTAFNRAGPTGALASQVQWQGGLFGSRREAFGPGSTMARFLKSVGRSDMLPGLGARPDATNFELVREQLKGMYGNNPMLMANAMASMFGMNDRAAMELLTMQPADVGSLQRSAEAAGVDLRKMNGEGIQNMARINSASGMAALGAIASDMQGWSGDNALSDADKKAIAGAGSESELRSVLLKIAADRGTERTTGDDIVRNTKSIETALTDLTRDLVPAVQDIRKGVLSLIPDRKSLTERLESAGILKRSAPANPSAPGPSSSGRIGGVADTVGGALGGVRGIRNNNPGNIEKSSIPWAGKVEGGDGRFESFESPEMGIRALGRNILSYQKKHGLRTVRQIVSRWAPPGENKTDAYVQAVARRLGVSPDEEVNVSDPAVLQAMAEAIITHENGGNPYSQDQIRAGVGMALGVTPVPGGAGGGGAGGGGTMRGEADVNVRVTIDQDGVARAAGPVQSKVGVPLAAGSR